MDKKISLIIRGLEFGETLVKNGLSFDILEMYEGRIL